MEKLEQEIQEAKLSDHFLDSRTASKSTVCQAQQVSAVHPDLSQAPVISDEHFAELNQQPVAAQIHSQQLQAISSVPHHTNPTPQGDAAMTDIEVTPHTSAEQHSVWL